MPGISDAGHNSVYVPIRTRFVRIPYQQPLTYHCSQWMFSGFHLSFGVGFSAGTPTVQTAPSTILLYYASSS